jgi:hypothetical protein
VGVDQQVTEVGEHAATVNDANSARPRLGTDEIETIFCLMGGFSGNI